MHAYGVGNKERPTKLELQPIGHKVSLCGWLLFHRFGPPNYRDCTCKVQASRVVIHRVDAEYISLDT